MPPKRTAIEKSWTTALGAISTGRRNTLTIALKMERNAAAITNITSGCYGASLGRSVSAAQGAKRTLEVVL